MKKLTRTYILNIDPNFHKMEEVRYSSQIYIKLLQVFVNKQYFNLGKSFSTEGLGTYADLARHKAEGIVKAEKKASLATGNKSNIPQIKFQICPATIKESKDTSFDYWINVTSQWKNKVKIPAKSHKCLNKALKNNWKMSDYCELTLKKGKWYVAVFVTKKVNIPVKKKKSIGVDVGIKKSVARSDNYLGANLSKVIKKERNRQKDRQRNKHLKKPFKSVVKQILDKEVNRVIRRSKRLNSSISVENPKLLANLKLGSLDRWARSYFGNRLQVRAFEEGVWIDFIHPAYTSITCSVCGKIDRKSRVNRDKFICTSCKSEFHADINAARNIALKGQERSCVSKTNKIPVR